MHSEKVLCPVSHLGSFEKSFTGHLLVGCKKRCRHEVRLTLVNLLLLRVDDANNLAEASLLLLARGATTPTSCEKTIGD